jgi:hypothetical protein
LQFSYSKVIQVKVGMDDAVHLLQNPVNSHLKLSVSNAFTGGSYAILDAGGRVLLVGNITTGLLSVPVSRLPAGTYHARVAQKNGSRSIALTFVRQ